MRLYDIFDARLTSGFIVRRVPTAWLANLVCSIAYKRNRIIWDYELSYFGA